MITSIGGASAAQAAYAPAINKKTEQAAAAQETAQASATQETAPLSTETQSALSSATARLGDQLGAQADASRVQRAREDMPPPADAATASGTGTKETAQAPAAAAAAPMRSGAAQSSEETTATDYIAEADTNSDKTVSDEERIAYEKKLEQQAEAATASSGNETQQAGSRAAELRQAYGLDTGGQSSLDITA